MLATYQRQNDITKAYVQMHLSILLWGLTGVLGRGIDLNEGLLVWYRLILVCISLGAYIYFTKKQWRVTRTQLLQLFGIGTLLMVHWLFFYGAIKYSNVSITLSTFASTALFTAVLEPLVRRTKFRKDELFFGVLVLLGIWLIFKTESGYALGIFLSLMATFIGSFFNILNKNIVQQISPSVVSFYELAGGFVALTLFMPLYMHLFPTDKVFPNTQDWWLLIVLAVFCTHFTMILSLAALKHLSAFTLNLSINLEPIYGIALAFIFFGENKLLGWGFYAGSALIMLSVLLHAYVSRTSKTKSNR